MTTHREAVEKLITELTMLSTVAKTSKFKYNFTINDVYLQMANELIEYVYLQMANELIEFSTKIELITVDEANKLKQIHTTR